MSPLYAMIIGTTLGMLIGAGLRRLADRLAIRHLRAELERARARASYERSRRLRAEDQYLAVLDMPVFRRNAARALVHHPIARGFDVSRN